MPPEPFLATKPYGGGPEPYLSARGGVLSGFSNFVSDQAPMTAPETGGGPPGYGGGRAVGGWGGRQGELMLFAQPFHLKMWHRSGTNTKGKEKGVTDLLCNPLDSLVGMRGVEPPAP